MSNKTEQSRVVRIWALKSIAIAIAAGLLGGLGAILLIAATAHSAEAQVYCANVYPGTVIINHRSGILYGRDFYARVSCTRNAPVLVYWRGGFMCTGRRFYGRSAWGSFSCAVRQLGYR
jgi:hypothetical protein